MSLSAISDEEGAELAQGALRVAGAEWIQLECHLRSYEDKWNAE